MRYRRRRPEDAIHRAILAHLRIRGPRQAFVFAVPNGGARSPVEASIMKGLGTVAGVPGFIILHEGRTYGLELKADGKKATARQLETHVAMRTAGAEIAVAVGLDAALRQLEAWNLLRGRAS
jgi:hypothetical protein